MHPKTPFQSLSASAMLALGLASSNLYAENGFSMDEVTPKHTASKLVEGNCGNGMNMDAQGMVMNENHHTLPKDCSKISEHITIKVAAGVQYSKPYPGTVFGLDAHSWHAKPCAKITVHLTNKDQIRHQWMLHGLPRYLYPKGMFHIEAAGGATKSGTFIVPSSHYTYLVHCDIAQHMAKGMKAQLVVGKGRGNLSSIPGISDPKYPNNYPSQPSTAQSTFKSEQFE